MASASASQRPRRAAASGIPATWSRESRVDGTAMGSAASTRTACRSGTTRPWRGSVRLPSRRPGGTCGSAVTRAVICRRSGGTPAGASNPAITRRGAGGETSSSSAEWAPSVAPSQGSAATWSATSPALGFRRVCRATHNRARTEYRIMHSPLRTALPHGWPTLRRVRDLPPAHLPTGCQNRVPTRTDHSAALDEVGAPSRVPSRGGGVRASGRAAPRAQPRTRRATGWTGPLRAR
jgi:hypothetical protein